MYEPIRTSRSTRWPATPPDFPHGRARRSWTSSSPVTSRHCSPSRTRSARSARPPPGRRAERLAEQVTRLRGGSARCARRPPRLRRAASPPSTGGPTPSRAAPWSSRPPAPTRPRRSSPPSAWTPTRGPRTPRAGHPLSPRALSPRPLVRPRSARPRATRGPGATPLPPRTGLLPAPGRPRSGIASSGCVPGPGGHFVFTPERGTLDSEVHAPGVRRIAGIVLAVLLIGGVAAAVVAGRDDQDKGTATKTVQGVIGSEKAEFFRRSRRGEGPRRQGLHREDGDLRVLGHGRASTSRGTTSPSPPARHPADELADSGRSEGRPAPRPFFSPARRRRPPHAAQVLAANGLATYRQEHRHAEDGRLSGRGPARADLAAAQGRRRAHGELTGTLYITTTDPETSNSGALFLAAASYVADGGRVAADDAAVERTAPLMHRLISVQGAQQPSTDAAFGDFVSGAGDPLVLVYESQVAALLAEGQDTGDLTVLYPDTTANSDRTRSCRSRQKASALGDSSSTTRVAQAGRPARVPAAGRRRPSSPRRPPARRLPQPEADRHPAGRPCPTSKVLHGAGAPGRELGGRAMT